MARRVPISYEDCYREAERSLVTAGVAEFEVTLPSLGAGVDQRKPPARAHVAEASGGVAPIVRAPRWGLRSAQTPATHLQIS